ncbi:hypothetical protein GQ607_007543 [Colletotrichum asianum]|uniref:Uncharacterized protein n=1 Tax=Colletotrichum asianum TaxID=702518 RepID=A0A8H3WAA4_9PEZI|nr:hypothetical protein GQ607_007543 [Colletotrichum asianum]
MISMVCFLEPLPGRRPSYAMPRPRPPSPDSYPHGHGKKTPMNHACITPCQPFARGREGAPFPSLSPLEAGAPSPPRSPLPSVY